MARLYGRSPRGTRAPGTARCGSWTRLSVLGALGHEGMLAAMSVEGATSGAVFRAYLERVLLPASREREPDAALVMDNLGAHKTPEVRELLDGSGFPYRYLPSYSPDLSPIEPAWAQVKAQCRSFYDPDGGREVDPERRLRAAGPQLVAAHLALDRARHPPAAAALHALLQDLGQHRLMQGGSRPRGEAPRTGAACAAPPAPRAGTRAGPGPRRRGVPPRASARAPRSGPAAAPRTPAAPARGSCCA